MEVGVSSLRKASTGIRGGAGVGNPGFRLVPPRALPAVPQSMGGDRRVLTQNISTHVILVGRYVV
jgi:hypothetical protein